MSWSLAIASNPLRQFIYPLHYRHRRHLPRHRHRHRHQNVTSINGPTTIHTVYNHLSPILCFCSHHSLGSTGDTVHETSDSLSDLVKPEGSGSSSMSKDTQGGSLTTSKILEQLKRYGVAGILSYGLLNTAYYLTAFLVVWFYFAPVPGNMGYVAAATRFLKVMAMVWAGSQVTKLMRAAGALALAPFVDTGLSWFTVRFKFESRGKAFFALVGFCVGLAIVLFLVVTLLWA